jgi:hypothetical protein
MSRRVRPLVSIVLLGLLAPRLVAAPVPPAQVLPGGIADAAGKTGYVTNETGGIDAIDLATGDLLWASKEGHRPVFVVGDRLYAEAPVQGRANALRLVALDLTAKGARVFESDPVHFPDWVSVEEAQAHSFTGAWRLVKGKMMLAWEARAWYGGGRKPSPEEEAAARKHAAGKIRIDLTTGQNEALPADKAEAPPKVPAALEKKTVRWQGVVGEPYAALVLEEDAGLQKLVLYSWDRATQKPAEPMELLQGKRLIVMPTMDGRFLCLRETNPRPDEKEGLEGRAKNAWFVFDPVTGARVAEAPNEPGAQGLVVLKPRAYYLVAGPLKGPVTANFVQTRALKAVDLSSGKVLWERPLEGKRFVPPPP